jgi:hypothetical protein
MMTIYEAIHEKNRLYIDLYQNKNNYIPYQHYRQLLKK